LNEWDTRSRTKFKLKTGYEHYKSEISSYTFGTPEDTTSRYEVFTRVLHAANQMGTHVYILTNGLRRSGSRLKIGANDVWATITVLDLEDYIDAVYSCGSNFDVTKYDCIGHILDTKHKSRTGEKVGYLFDDDNINGADSSKCKSIVFEHVSGNLISGHVYPGNSFYEEIASHCFGFSCEGLSSDRMELLIGEIQSGQIQFLFFDWDCTLQTHNGPVPFWNSRNHPLIQSKIGVKPLA